MKTGINYEQIHQNICTYLSELANNDSDEKEKDLIKFHITTTLSLYPKQTLDLLQETLAEIYCDKLAATAQVAHYLMQIFNRNELVQSQSSEIEDEVEENVALLYQSLYSPKELFPRPVRERIHYFPISDDIPEPITLCGINIFELVQAMTRTTLVGFLATHSDDITKYISENEREIKKNLPLLLGFGQSFLDSQTKLIQNAIEKFPINFDQKPTSPPPKKEVQSRLGTLRHTLYQFFYAPSQYPKSLSLVSGMLVASAFFGLALPLNTLLGYVALISILSYSTLKLRQSFFEKAYLVPRTVTGEKSFSTVAANEAYQHGHNAAQGYRNYLISFVRPRDWANYQDFGAGMQSVFNAKNENKNPLKLK